MISAKHANSMAKANKLIANSKTRTELSLNTLYNHLEDAIRDGKLRLYLQSQNFDKEALDQFLNEAKELEYGIDYYESWYNPGSRSLIEIYWDNLNKENS